MVNRIIEEIQKSLKQENYLAALTMALTLPDICGKAAEPSLGTGARYKKWYKDNVVLHEKTSDPHEADMPYCGADMPYLSEEVIYQLRNSMLHQGNPNVDAKSIREEQCKIDEFILFVDEPYDSGLSVVSYEKELNGKKLNEKKLKITNRKLEVNLVLTCNRICNAAKEYYERNTKRFDFFNYTFENRKKSREEYERVLNLLQGKHEK
ncbi:MAG: hypothetical protein MR790_10505 [Clostridiales bacterium]|nr:hypothetical protein [Clostridiales bacterium]